MDFLVNAIKTKFDSNATLAGSVTGIYFEFAPENTAFPYITIHLIPGAKTERTHSGNMEVRQVMFSIWSESGQGREVSTIFNYLTTAFDNCTLTYSDGYNSRKVTRTDSDLSWDNRVWIYNVTYEFQIRGVT